CNELWRFVPPDLESGVDVNDERMRVIANGLSLWQQNQLDYSDLRDEFLTRFSSLEDDVGQMAARISRTEQVYTYNL
ncbi:hypothetical protein Tco_1140653, partial [Tanacetum coccineum]